MRWRYFVSALALVLIFAGTAAAQGTQTGTIRGVVTTPDKASVAGVTITISSPALQAERSTTSEADGSFLFLGLPPGAYTVKFAKNSLKSAEKKADVPLGGVAELNTTMELANRAETVNVVGDTPSVLSTPTVGANITQKTVEALPMGRTIVGIASLSPGLTLNTPNSNQVTINGAFAYDNVFLINGVDINDNLFGSPQRLFIEDAIQETQVMTSGISAEYGRFSGGIINAITKSGGNQFSGSFRANLSNPTWSKQTPFDIEHGNLPDSKLNRNFEATLGGPIVKDKIWFFGATRVSRLATPATFDITGVAYDTTNNNTRGELKLTMTPVSNHTVTVSYINNNTTFTDATFDFSIDPHTIINGHEPNSIIGVTWRGLLKGKYFTEAGYSQRQFSFLDEGGTSTDIVNSPFIALSELSHYNAPYFDATDPEDRDNRQLFGNLNWSVTAGGRHDMKVGYEWYRSHHTGGNSQSSTNYVFDADYLTSGGNPVYDANGYLIPVFTPFETLLENWMAVRGATSNTDTHSLFFQDHWAATRRLSFDLGVRFEKVRSEATGNILGVDTQTIVPRLAMA